MRASWDEQQINNSRLEVMTSCRPTQPSTGFSLIIDDSGHRKSAPPAARFPRRKDGARSGNFTSGVGRQYIGEIGKTENGIVVVTTHLYDGVKSLPLDIELDQHANSLPQGKTDPEFLKKPEIALNLIERSLKRKYRPGIVIVDSGYGNNTSFLQKLENRKLNYLGGIAKNRKVTQNQHGSLRSIRMDELAQGLPQEAFTEVELNLDKPKKVWVTTLQVELSKLEGIRSEESS